MSLWAKTQRMLGMSLGLAQVMLWMAWDCLRDLICGEWWED